MNKGKGGFRLQICSLPRNGDVGAPQRFLSILAADFITHSQLFVCLHFMSPFSSNISLSNL